jgi:hypothetical protein
MSNRADHDFTSNFDPIFKSQLHRTYLGRPLCIKVGTHVEMKKEMSETPQESKIDTAAPIGGFTGIIFI